MKQDTKTVKVNIAKCYASFKKSGSVCGGCQWSYNCQMDKDTYTWLSTKFLPSVDPAGLVLGKLREKKA